MVINPLNKFELEKIFSESAQNLIKYFLFKSFFSQPAVMEDQKKLPIHIPKEHLEQWLVQSLGASPVGSGSYPVDVVDIKRNFAADAKMLAWNGKPGNMSNETSLLQKFKDAGNDLDIAFKQNKFDGVVSDWSRLLKKKLNKVKKDYKTIQKIYYFFLIREDRNFHLCGMDVDIEKLSLISVDRNTKSSVWIKDFIEPRYGKSNIYKAKKRMELRLYPSNWIKDNLVISFKNPNISVKGKNLKGMDVDSLHEHALELFNKLFEEIVGCPNKNK
tara:strand:+ start:198 stop:1016 length:819 start_codon:yes stop_codon:yes gene_type:complete